MQTKIGRLRIDTDEISAWELGYLLDCQRVIEATSGKKIDPNLLTMLREEMYRKQKIEQQEREHDQWLERQKQKEQGLLIERKPIGKEKRAEVWKKTNGHCYYCGCDIDPFISFSIDHLIPHSNGGKDTIDNLFPVCRKCNARKKNGTLEDLRRRLAPVHFTPHQIEWLKSRGLFEEQFMPEPFVFYFERIQTTTKLTEGVNDELGSASMGLEHRRHGRRSKVGTDGDR